MRVRVWWSARACSVTDYRALLRPPLPPPPRVHVISRYAWILRWHNAVITCTRYNGVITFARSTEPSSEVESCRVGELVKPTLETTKIRSLTLTFETISDFPGNPNPPLR